MCKLITELPLMWKNVLRNHQMCVWKGLKHIWSFEILWNRKDLWFQRELRNKNKVDINNNVNSKIAWEYTKAFDLSLLILTSWTQLKHLKNWFVMKSCFNNNVHSKIAKEYTKAFNPSLFIWTSWRQIKQNGFERMNCFYTYVFI